MVKPRICTPDMPYVVTPIARGRGRGLLVPGTRCFEVKCTFCYMNLELPNSMRKNTSQCLFPRLFLIYSSNILRVYGPVQPAVAYCLVSVQEQKDTSLQVTFIVSVHEDLYCKCKGSGGIGRVRQGSRQPFISRSEWRAGKKGREKSGFGGFQERESQDGIEISEMEKSVEIRSSGMCFVAETWASRCDSTQQLKLFANLECAFNLQTATPGPYAFLRLLT